MVHLDISIECYGCSRMFTTYSGMIIHLESGSCDSGITNVDLNQSAAMCYQWRHCIHKEYCDEMLEERDLSRDYIYTIYPFKCPTCGSDFSKLSGLFQHIDSQACEQTLASGAIGKLVRWLERRHDKNCEY
jgi:hypothetical protein